MNKQCNTVIRNTASGIRSPRLSLILILYICVSLGKLLDLPMPQFSYL